MQLRIVPTRLGSRGVIKGSLSLSGLEISSQVLNSRPLDLNGFGSSCSGCSVSVLTQRFRQIADLCTLKFKPGVAEILDSSEQMLLSSSEENPFKAPDNLLSYLRLPTKNQ